MENKQEKPAMMQYLLPKELESELHKACEEMTAEHHRPITLEVLGALEDDECYGNEYRIRIGETGDGEQQQPVPMITYNIRGGREAGSFQYQIDDIRMMVKFYVLGTALANKYRMCTYDAAGRYFRLQTCDYATSNSLVIYVTVMSSDNVSISCTINSNDKAIRDNMPAFAKSGLVTWEIPLIRDSRMSLSYLAKLYDSSEKPPYSDHTEQISPAEKYTTKRETWIKLFRSSESLGASMSAPKSIYGAYMITRAIGDYDAQGLKDRRRMHLLDSALTLIMNDPRVTITKNVVIPNDISRDVPPSVGYIEFEVGENKFFLYCNFVDDGDVRIVETSTNSVLTIRTNWTIADKYPDIGEPIRRFLGL